MTVPVPTCEPRQLVAGDSVQWSRSLSSYPPSAGWTLHYRLVGPSVPASQPVAEESNGAFLVTLDAAAMAATNFIAGTYRMSGWVTKDSERHTVYDGFVDVQPNLAVVSFDAVQTHAERMLAACEARLEGRLTADVSRYGREGSFVEKLPIEQVRAMRGTYSAMVWREQNPNSLAPVARIAFGSGRSTAWPGASD